MAEQGEAPATTGQAAFWQRPAFLALLVAACAIPLLWPAIPPLTDLPGHLAHYHVSRALDGSPDLQRFYGFDWALTANLGVDLLILPVAALFGVELGTKLIVIAIPMLLAGGFLGVSRELHGRVPPTALFALPLVYHHAFQFGFLNFSLSTALCFLAFWLWLSLGRAGRVRLRAALFVPIACAIWTAHIYGWAILGILVFAAQTIERRRQGAGWAMAPVKGAKDCLPLALPLLMMLIWRSGDVQNDTGGWFLWTSKFVWTISILRERWQEWDLAGANLLLAIAIVAPFLPGVTMDPRARLAAILLLITFLLMPRVLIGSGYADMRLAAFVVAVAIIGLRPGRPWHPVVAMTVAVAGLLFLAARLGGTTVAYAQIDRQWHTQAAAIDHIPRGSRVLVLTDKSCTDWADDRLNHLSSLAVVRKDAFTNGQWTIPGGLLMTVRYRDDAPFTVDPSHLVRRPPCGDRDRLIPLAIKTAPGRFDYIWLVGLPRPIWPRDPRLIPVWQSDRGLLLRVENTRTTR